MARVFLQDMVDDIPLDILSANWQTFDLVTFSRSKRLWDYQRKAVENAVKVLWRYYEDFNDYNPIAFLTYCNLILKHGVAKFAQDAVDSGVDGVVIADLPPEEASELISSARERDFATIFLAAPTSTPERIEFISEACIGFVYCVSLTGVTGARNQISDMLAPTLRRIREHTDKPVAVGFGVSNPDQAREVASMADGVIVGSAIVNVIEAHADDPDKLLSSVGEFASSLAEAVKSV